MGPVRSCAARGTYRCGKGPVISSCCWCCWRRRPSGWWGASWPPCWHGGSRGSCWPPWLVSMGLGLMIADIMLPVVYQLGPERARPWMRMSSFLPLSSVLLGAPRLGLVRWDRPVLAGSAARACCPGGLCPGATGAPGGDAPVLLDLLQDLRQEGVLRWTGRGRPCGAERRWGWRWLSSVLPGALSRTVRRPGE